MKVTGKAVVSEARREKTGHGDHISFWQANALQTQLKRMASPRSGHCHELVGTR